MNKRLLSKLEQGEGTTLMGKLFLTRRQRQVILKWCLFSLVYLVLQVMQDVLFSRIQIWGGCPDLVPGYLLLVCLMQGPGSGGLFALLAGVFRSLSGAVLGPVSLLVTTCAGVLLSAFRGGYLQRRFWSVMLCVWAGIFLHQGLLFALGLFLGSTSAGHWLGVLGGSLGTGLACCALYPLALALGRIGGEPWNE